MREILELCVEMDRLAEHTYVRMAEACGDPEDKALFERLAEEEATHASWWDGLLVSWDEGLIPDIFADSEQTAERVRMIFDSMRAEIPTSFAGMSCHELLTISARLEFHMLDPLFDELLALAEPAIADERQRQYHGHMSRLFAAIEDGEPQGSLLAFLANVLRRVLKDNVELVHNSSTDPLTGMLNRRSFNSHLQQLTAWSARYGRPITVVLVDIDNFKVVNDTFGHPVGDALLVSVATALRQLVRCSDLVARYGGDEFAILAPETDAAQAAELTHRIVETIPSICMSHDDRTICVTVSVGSATSDILRADPARLREELVAAADHSMYEAKAAGRNRAGDAAVFAG